jgi:thiol-disulfide isomerase/thioredoxin
MKKLILILGIVMLAPLAFSQTINQTKIDEKSQMEVMTGIWSREELQASDLFKMYYDPEYKAYTPEISVLDNIKIAQAGKQITIKIVMGSWCGDSQEQVPRFLKILDVLSFPDTSVTLICVDRTKKSLNGETDNLNIQLIPTFIIYTDGKEIGRIVETPKETLEKDLLTIIK